jgi:hypothetical protein
MPVILATQEAEIRRILGQSQPEQIVRKTLPWKTPSQKRAGGEAQGAGPEFNLQHHKKKGNHDLEYAPFIRICSLLDTYLRTYRKNKFFLFAGLLKYNSEIKIISIVVYNIMFWNTYTVWNDCRNQAN